MVVGEEAGPRFLRSKVLPHSLNEGKLFQVHVFGPVPTLHLSCSERQEGHSQAQIINKLRKMRLVLALERLLFCIP